MTPHAPTPTPSHPFESLGLLPTLCRPLTRAGYTQPTPVQASAIPIILTGRDLVARAQTGTGKTAAFALPILQRLLAAAPGAAAGRPASVRRPRALVLVPTRELAVQVARAITKYGADVHIRTTAVFGGVGMGPQVHALRHGVDVIVATPGRLIDHVQQRTVDLSAVEVLTLDEADRMLDIGFLPALRRLLAVLPRTRQTLLFSATLPPAVLGLSADMMSQPQRVDVSPQAVATTVTHQVHPVASHRKAEMLTHVLTRTAAGQALVFCQTKRGADRVARHLEHLGEATAVIHGNKSQSARTRALDGFRAGRVRVLVATDIAARGLDIAQLPLVVNYDLPLVAEDYIHRIGRTGRAGVAGRAVSLVSSADAGLLRDIQRLLPATIERVTLEGFEATVEEPAPRPAGRPAPSRQRGRFNASRPAGAGRRFHRSARASH